VSEASEGTVSPVAASSEALTRALASAADRLDVASLPDAIALDASSPCEDAGDDGPPQPIPTIVEIAVRSGQRRYLNRILLSVPNQRFFRTFCRDTSGNESAGGSSG
jgi:hypothetical protein